MPEMGQIAIRCSSCAGPRRPHRHSKSAGTVKHKVDTTPYERAVPSAQAFVQFAHAIGCAGAKNAIHGRMFAGATVQANYVSAEAFAAAAGPPSG